VSLYPDRTGSRRKTVRQTETYLDKVGIRNRAHVFRRHVETLTVTAGKINYNRRRRFTRPQMQVAHKHEHSRVPIRAQIQEVVAVKDGERISQQH
jgi:hypothetical protein